jgi:Arc/MetJ-type ribon-helix-helix transcriptional regulator
MNVDFAPDVQVLVQQAIASGRLNRAEDAVQEALSMWAEQERRKAQNRTADLAKSQAAVARIRELRKGVTLPEGVTIRDLINEGRA